MPPGKMQNVSVEVLNGFHARIMKLLAAPVPPATAPVRGTLFPPDQPPGLLIYLGDATAPDVASLRAQLPSTSFLLFLYPADQAGAAAIFESREAALGRTLWSSLNPNAFPADKVGLLVSILQDRTVRLVVGSGRQEQFKKELAEIHEAINSALHNARHESTRGQIKLRCSIRNLPLIAKHSALKPARVPPGLTAVVCGAGPSLITQLDFLKSLQRRVTIVIVGHALPTLAGAGIVPDVVVEDDSVAEQNWAPDLRTDALLTSASEVSPGIAARFERILWSHGSSMPFNMLLGNLGVNLQEVTLNKTVSVHAIDFAVRAGFDRVVLIGQDLSISPTGRMHAEGGSVASGDQLTEIPGNDGGPVLATIDLMGLREGVESYLRLLAQLNEIGKTRTEVVNGTRGGAVIAGAGRLSFEDFCASVPPEAQVPALFTQGEKFSPDMEQLHRIVGSFEQYAGVAGGLVEVCRRMRRELEAYPVNLQKVRGLQEELQAGLRREESVRSVEESTPLLNSMMLQVDDVMKQIPGLVTEDINPAAQLTLLQTRFRFARDLCLDLHGELAEAARAIAAAGDEGAAAKGSPYIFQSFKKLAVETIRRENDELASFLARPAPGALEQFKLAWINQLIPYVCIRRGETWTPLSPFSSMYEQAARDVEAFLASSGFDPARNSVTFVGAGNWSHVVDFSRRFPFAQAMVADPWPDLLAVMIERGVFVHRLPPKALVVCTGERFKKWQKLYSGRMNAWKKQGLQNILFLHPRAGELPEIGQLLDQLKTL